MRTGFAVNITNNITPPRVFSACIHSSNTSASRSFRQRRAGRATPPCGPEKFQPRLQIGRASGRRVPFYLCAPPKIHKEEVRR